MPKFLDAPSWYDSDGTLRTIQDTISVKVGGYTSSIVLPTLSNISTSYDAYFVPGTSGQFAGGVYWFSSNGPQISGQGKTGDVLVSNGTGAPSWKPMQLYLHTGRIYRTANPSASTPSVDLYYNYYSTSSSAATSSSSLVSALGSMGFSGANYRLTACGIYKTSSEFYYISYLYIYRSNIYIGAASDGGATQNLNTSSFVSHLTFSESVIQLFH